MNGTPVSPSTDTVVSALPAASEPPAANSHVLPADAGVARARRAPRPPPSRGPTRPGGGRTGGCRRRRPRRRSRHAPPPGGRRYVTAPSPPGAGISTSSIGIPIAQPRRVGLRQPRLDAHLAGQLDVADAVGLERPPGRRRRAGTSGGKHWIVQVHSVPRRASRRSSTSRRRAARRTSAWRGKATTPQRRHSRADQHRRAPVRAGVSDATVSAGIDARRLERDRGRARDHVARHPPVGVELRDREEGPDPLAVVVARLAERELDVAGAAAGQHVVRPVAHVAGVDEARAAPRGRRRAGGWRGRSPSAHWIANSTSSATSSSEECGSGPSRAAK